MFSYATVGEWARREALLVSCVTAALALFAVAEGFGISAMRTIGLLVAAVGALGRLAIAWRRVALERGRERAEFDLRTRVPIASVSSIDPTAVGIDAAAPQTVISGGVVPEYLPRDVDEELRAAIRMALHGDDRWIIVAVGRSKVGKSRALFEALRHCLSSPETSFIAPVDVDALKALLVPGEIPISTNDRCVLWLDDLEPFLNEGLTFPLLRAWRQANPRGIVAATYGGKADDPFGRSARGYVATVAGEILRHAKEVRVMATTAGELEALQSTLPPTVKDAIERHGLAAYLVAAAELERKLTTRRHAPAEPECPEGVAVVRVVVDWARCGRTDLLPSESLQKLWQAYLPPGVDSSSAGLEAGIAWALQPVAGTIALVEQLDGYRAYDLVVSLMPSSVDDAPQPDVIWDLAIAGTTGAQAFGVAANALLQGRYQHAVKGFEIASRDANDDIAAMAGVNLGNALGAMHRLDDAIAAYDQYVERFKDSEKPVQREGLAFALLAKGAACSKLGQREEELAAYDEMIALLSDTGDITVRILLVKALVNRGVVLRSLGQPAAVMTTADDVWTRYGSSGDPALEEQVLQALSNKATLLEEDGRFTEALEVYDAILEQVNRSDLRSFRRIAAKTLASRGVCLGKQGQNERALAVFNEVVDRFGGEDDPPFKEAVAKALLGKAISWESLGDFKAAIAAYTQIWQSFPDVTEGFLGEIVANAMLTAGETLGGLGSEKEAVMLLHELAERFQESEHARIRVVLAQALAKKGLFLDALGLPDEAIATYEVMLARFDNAEDSALAAIVARVLVSKGFAHGRLGSPKAAIAAFDVVLQRLRGATDPEHVEAFAMALVGRGEQLERLGQLDDALAIFEEIDARFAGSETAGVHKLVARALFNKANVLERQNQTDEALATREELMRRFRDSRDPTLRAAIANAIAAQEDMSSADRGQGGD